MHSQSVRQRVDAHDVSRAIECRENWITSPDLDAVLSGYLRHFTRGNFSPFGRGPSHLGCLVTHTVSAEGEQEKGSATVACAKWQLQRFRA